MRITHLALGAVLALSPLATAQTCMMENYGSGCGPVANGTVTPNGAGIRFAFTMSNAAPRTRLLLVVGVSPTATPLPFTSCLLLTQLAFTQAHRTNAAGTYSFSHQIPGGPGGFIGIACVQFIEVQLDQNNNLVLRPTNGVQMTCK